MFYATARADSVVTYSVCRRTHPVDGRDMLLGGSARVVYKSYSRRPRLCAGVMVMVEKGDVVHSAAGCSFRRELGLRRVARGFLRHADEGAPGRLVQQGTVGEVHLVPVSRRRRRRVFIDQGRWSRTEFPTTC